MSVSVASAQLNADKYISLARADLEEQNHSLAIQRLNFALKTSPYNVEAFFIRAMAFIDPFDQIIVIKFNIKLVMFNFGFLY